MSTVTPAEPSVPVVAKKPRRAAASTPAPAPQAPRRALKSASALPTTAVEVAASSASVVPEPASAVETAGAASAAKLKLVRDSFTIPQTEYAQLDQLKQRALVLAHHVKKSELLRAGIAALVALDDAALLQALQAVTPIKTGRPKGAKLQDKHKPKSGARKG